MKKGVLEMFDNIGGKIKGAASFISVSGIIASIIAGVDLVSKETVIVGLIIIIVGSLFSWVGSFLLYGFGQLVENSDIIAEQSNRDNIKYEKTVKKQQEIKNKKEIQETKKKIQSDSTRDDEYIDIHCPKCGEILSYFKDDFLNNDTIVCPLCEKEFSTEQFK